MKTSLSPTFWRFILNGWSIVLFGVIVWDFVTNNGLHDIVGPIAAIYTAILAIFSAEKEFGRWYESVSGRHFGEVYVVVWTLLLLGIFGVDAIFQRSYEMPSEIISTFIAVLGILAITNRSKKLFKRKRL